MSKLDIKVITKRQKHHLIKTQHLTKMKVNAKIRTKIFNNYQKRISMELNLIEKIKLTLADFAWKRKNLRKICKKNRVSCYRIKKLFESKSSVDNFFSTVNSL